MSANKDKKLKHLGIIMDGNRRWAKQNGKTKLEGHKAGYKTLKSLLKTVKELEIDYLSVYAFSTENRGRTKDEVDSLMGLSRWGLSVDLDELIKEKIRIVWAGREQGLPKDIVKMIQSAVEKTANFTEGTLVVCFNYGGKQEIVDAANRAVANGQEINQDTITEHLYASDVPPIDLIIRTSGEKRLSNFMLWRADYSEFHFTDTLWPDFSGEELTDIVKQYFGRERRFGA